MPSKLFAFTRPPFPRQGESSEAAPSGSGAAPARVARWMTYSKRKAPNQLRPWSESQVPFVRRAGGTIQGLFPPAPLPRAATMRSGPVSAGLGRTPVLINGFHRGLNAPWLRAEQPPGPPAPLLPPPYTALCIQGLGWGFKYRLKAFHHLSVSCRRAARGSGAGRRTPSPSRDNGPDRALVWRVRESSGAVKFSQSPEQCQKSVFKSWVSDLS